MHCLICFIFLSQIVTKFNHSLTLNLGVIVDMDFMEQSQYMLRKVTPLEWQLR